MISRSLPGKLGSMPRQNRIDATSEQGYADIQPIDVSANDFLVGASPTKAIFARQAGLIRCFMFISQLQGRLAAGQTSKREAEDDPGVDSTGFLTRAVTIPVFVGENKYRIIRIYKTGTDSALLTGQLFAAYGTF